MPYVLRKVRNKTCYKVYNKKSKKVFAKCSTKKNAKKQLRLLKGLEYGNLKTRKSKSNKIQV